jgi:hypothetical protein
MRREKAGCEMCTDSAARRKLQRSATARKASRSFNSTFGGIDVHEASIDGNHAIALHRSVAEDGVMPSFSLPCVLRRAGTSRGPFFLRDGLLIGAIGASDLPHMNTVRLWVQDHEGWLTMDTEATLE